MLAIRQYEFGPPSTLTPEEVSNPDPAAGEVLIAVEAAGVHLVDTSIRRGEAFGPVGVAELPMTPGREVAGTICALGPGTTGVGVGDRVAVHLGFANGGYAELAVAPVEALQPLPAGLDAPVAVAAIGTGRTATGVLELAGIEAGDLVVIPSAAGGMGALLTQGVVRAGAEVVGLASGGKLDLAREAGAGLAFDYRNEGWPAAVRQALGERRPGVVLDGVGGAVGDALLDLLADGGRIVSFGWSGGGDGPPKLNPEHEQRGLTVQMALGERMMTLPGGKSGLEERSIEAAAAGERVPLVHPPFALEDAARAHEALEARETAGKVVLVP